MKKIIAVSLLLQTLISCSNTAQPPPTATAIPTPVATVTRIPSPVPSTETLEVQTQPAAQWNDIPIMPGAIAGEGDEEGYVFTIQATPAQVQEYYQTELGKLGWQPLSQEEKGSSVTLLFTDNVSTTLTISILSNGDQALVLLAK